MSHRLRSAPRLTANQALSISKKTVAFEHWKRRVPREARFSERPSTKEESAAPGRFHDSAVHAPFAQSNRQTLVLHAANLTFAYTGASALKVRRRTRSGNPSTIWTSSSGG